MKKKNNKKINSDGIYSLIIGKKVLKDFENYKEQSKKEGEK